MENAQPAQFGIPAGEHLNLQHLITHAFSVPRLQHPCDLVFSSSLLSPSLADSLRSPNSTLASVLFPGPHCDPCFYLISLSGVTCSYLDYNPWECFRLPGTLVIAQG